MVLVILAGCGPSAPDGSLLLISERDGKPVTWVASPDGAPLRPLGALPGATFPAAPDPRGTHALVVATEDSHQGHRESLWLAPLDGGTPTQLVRWAGLIRNPAWAPDGAWLVFESDANSFRDLYRIDRDGGEPLRLTDAPYGSFEPAISPDGARILFGASRDDNAEVYVMQADGSAPVRLTVGVTDDVRPRWSPDGRTVTWITQREGTSRIWRMAPDGTDPRPLRVDRQRTVDLDYAWSPDGSRIAVVSQTGPNAVGITIVDPETGATLTTLDGEGPDEQPAWSPDGRWLAFTSSREGSADVFLATAEGTHLRRLTTSSGADWLARWVGTPL